MRQEEYFYDIWKRNGKRNEDMEPILKELEPAIYQSVQKWTGGVLSDSQLTIRAKLLAVEAIKDWSPTAGASLFTYVMDRLKKLSRDVYNSNIVYQPEQKVLDYNHYLNVKKQLEDEVGGIPGMEDLRMKTGWSEKKILDLERNFQPNYNDIFIKTKNYFEVTHISDEDLMYAYNNLSPEEQELFTLKTGWPSGKKAHGIVDIAKKKNMSIGYLSQRYKDIATKIKSTLGV